MNNKRVCSAWGCNRTDETRKTVLLRSCILTRTLFGLLSRAHFSLLFNHLLFNSPKGACRPATIQPTHATRVCFKESLTAVSALLWGEQILRKMRHVHRFQHVFWRREMFWRKVTTWRNRTCSPSSPAFHFQKYNPGTNILWTPTNVIYFWPRGDNAGAALWVCVSASSTRAGWIIDM